jgi:hypothetical protein
MKLVYCEQPSVFFPPPFFRPSLLPVESGMTTPFSIT